MMKAVRLKKGEAFVHFPGKFLQGLGRLKNSGNSGEKQDTFDRPILAAFPRQSSTVPHEKAVLCRHLLKS